jgi:hypothetical protein
MLAIVVASWWLSLGPLPRVLGRSLEIWSPYRVLYDYVPGFEGVRVPARFAMLVAFGLAMLSGLGIWLLERFRAGLAIAAVACVAFLVEAHVPPLWLNGVAPVRDFAMPAERVYRPGRAPAVYHALNNMPPDAVVLEIPFGVADYDLRSVYYSTVHWRRLVNGYSGFFPPHYSRAIAMISAGPRGGDITWEALNELGVTHIVVHEAAYLDDEGLRFGEWLRQRGAVEVFRDGRDLLLSLPR